MLEKPIEQKVYINITNYNDFWENQVAEVVEIIYKSESYFLSAYSSNSDKVFDKVQRKMKVVPIDIRETLQAFYSRMVKSQPNPPDGAGYG